MKLTLDLPETLLSETLRASGKKSKREAVCWAMRLAVQQKALKAFLSHHRPIEFDRLPEDFEAAENHGRATKNKRTGGSR